MNLTKLTLASLVAGAMFTSCSSDDDNNISNLDNPSNYEFYRNNETSVSYSGQTTRLLMVDEIFNDLSQKNDAAKSTITSAEINTKFQGETIDGNLASVGFTDTSLNGTTKVVGAKTASKGVSTTTSAYIQDVIEEFDDVNNNFDTSASSGIAGRFTDGQTIRFVNAKGLELDQIFAKSLIGALVYDQAVNNYLKDLDTDENDVVDSGSNYTEAEHHFDEAYGYVYGLDGTDKSDILMNKYIGKVNGQLAFNGIADDIKDAFSAGRAAIVAKNTTVRDASVEILREKLNTIIAVRAVYYLANGANDIDGYDAGDAGRTVAFHGLSEGYGFVQSLRYLVDANGAQIFSDDKVQEYIDSLEGNTIALTPSVKTVVSHKGLWAITPARLNEIASEIAAKFTWSVADASN